MVPENWKAMRENVLQQIAEGIISMDRLDEAVTRILTAKARIGLLDERKPHEFSDNFLKSDKHQALARQAVRESLVLLKNNNNTLPLLSPKRIGVMGKAANLIRYQTGGWTITWQGSENKNSDFIDEISILEALTMGAKEEGHTVIYSENGLFDEEIDLVISVYGEEPYAEMLGDIETMAFKANDLAVLPSLQKYQDLNIPTLSIFLSGRPMEVNAYLNASDAFIAAWLPGTGVQGIADLLFRPNEYDFSGKLSFSWPKYPSQTSLNFRDSDYDPLFPLGYGLTYGDTTEVPELDVPRSESSSDFNIYLGVGRQGFEEYLFDNAKLQKLETDDYISDNSNFSVERFQYVYQDDSKRIVLANNANSYGIMSAAPLVISDYSNGIIKLVARSATQEQTIIVAAGSGNDNAVAELTLNTGWNEYQIPLSCFGGLSELQSIFFSSETAATIELNSIALSKETLVANCYSE
jgi:beta-glucosidase